MQGRISKSKAKEEKITDEFKGVQFALVCFIGATFIAIIYQAIAGPATVIDLYISLLVCFGTQFFLIPVFIWRVITGFRPEIVMGWLCLAQLVRSGWYGQIRSVWADLGRLGQITCKAGSASFTCIVLLELLSSSPA